MEFDLAHLFRSTDVPRVSWVGFIGLYLSWEAGYVFSGS